MHCCARSVFSFFYLSEPSWLDILERSPTSNVLISSFLFILLLINFPRTFVDGGGHIGLSSFSSQVL